MDAELRADIAFVTEYFHARQDLQDLIDGKITSLANAKAIIDRERRCDAEMGKRVQKYGQLQSIAWAVYDQLKFADHSVNVI